MLTPKDVILYSANRLFANPLVTFSNPLSFTLMMKDLISLFLGQTLLTVNFVKLRLKQSQGLHILCLLTNSLEWHLVTFEFRFL